MATPTKKCSPGMLLPIVYACEFQTRERGRGKAMTKNRKEKEEKKKKQITKNIHLIMGLFAWWGEEVVTVFGSDVKMA